MKQAFFVLSAKHHFLPAGMAVLAVLQGQSFLLIAPLVNFAAAVASSPAAVAPQYTLA